MFATLPSVVEFRRRLDSELPCSSYNIPRKSLIIVSAPFRNTQLFYWLDVKAFAHIDVASCSRNSSGRFFQIRPLRTIYKTKVSCTKKCFRSYSEVQPNFVNKILLSSGGMGMHNMLCTNLWTFIYFNFLEYPIKFGFIEKKE